MTSDAPEPATPGSHRHASTRVRHWPRRLAIGVATLTVLALVIGALGYRGIVWPNRLFAARYPVDGVDVSVYQGDIDWRVLAAQGPRFAYIKASEGSDFTDARFATNWAGAKAAGMTVGAYHFMSFDSSGEAQAAHVIATVPRDAGMLPPAVDIEFYGPYFSDPPTERDVSAIVQPLLSALEKHYGRPPLIYATAKAYERYIAGRYPENPVWIRSVLVPPTLPDGRKWTMWQYSNRDRLAGYRGEEEFIDRNVFAGTPADFEELLLP